MPESSGGEAVSDQAKDKPNPELSPSEQATDRMTHGLLRLLHSSSDGKESRIRRVLEHIDRAEDSRHARQSRRFLRLVPLASVAMIMAVVISVFVISPQPSAYAIVNDAITATRSTGMLRYEIFAVDSGREQAENRIGSLDMHGELSLVRLSTPHGHEFVMGRDASGEWSLRRDGSVERLTPRGASPRWINLGESTILIGSVDLLLAQLQNEYEVERVASDKAGSASDALILLIAERRPQIDLQGPRTIRVWVDPRSSLVERLELEWPQPPSAAGERGRRGGGALPPPPHAPEPWDQGDAIQDAFLPELLPGPPIFDDRHHPPPPERIVFQRAEPVLLTESAFSPNSP